MANFRKVKGDATMPDGQWRHFAYWTGADEMRVFIILGDGIVALSITGSLIGFWLAGTATNPLPPKQEG